MLAAIYARKSTEQTGVADEEKSVTRQIERARAYAERKGWAVAEEHVYVDDGISGAEFGDVKRPGLARLMNALKGRPPFRALVMSEESRLGRELIETAWLLKQITTRGVRVFYYLEDRERTLDSPTEKLLLSVSAFADEVERDKARQRTYDTMLRKAKAGHVTGGTVYGYDNVRVDKSRVERRINQAEAAGVRRIFELYVKGRGLTRIAKTLNAEGVAPPRGHGHGWAPTAVREILRRELYRGVIVWNKTRKRDGWGVKAQHRRPETEWLRVECADLRIVPEDLWQQAEARRRAGAVTFIRAAGGRLLGRPSCEDFESPYLLSGLARCGVCGGALVALTRGQGTKFYGCAYNQKRGATVCANRLEIRQERLDEPVLTALAMKFDPAMVESAVVEAVRRLQAGEAERRERRASLEAEARGVESRVRNLLEAVKRGIATDALLQEVAAEEARRATIADALAALNGDDRAAGLEARQVAAQVAGFARDLLQLLRQRTPQARQMIRKVLNHSRLVCQPFRDDQGEGYRFSARGTYGPLFTGLRYCNDGGVPEGNRPM